VTQTGAISVIQNWGATDGTETLIGSSSVNQMFPNVWHFIEIYVKAGGSGQIIIKVDGVIVLTATGKMVVNNKPAYYNMVRWVMNDRAVTEIDDLYILDTAGSGFNDFLGDVVIHGVLPNSDAGPNQCSVFGGGLTHYSAVDDIPIDEDQSYLYSNEAGAQELFGIDTLPQNVIDVLAVSVHCRVKKDSAGAGFIKTLVKENGTLQVNAAQPVPTNYITRCNILPSAPDGTGWTKAKAQGMKIGFEVA
jgi:hypothetical protein